ncbi:MAG: arginase [Vicinamibacterales bacterium]
MSETPARLVHVIGVPLDLGGARRGVDMGPSALRIAGLGDRLGLMGCGVVDKGNVMVPIRETQAASDPHKKYIGEIAAVCQRVYDDATASLEAGALPVILGGDHSLAAGSVAASSDAAARQNSEIGLIWLDAHGDMNTPASSTSGNVHGMPLAALLGDEPSELARIGVRHPSVRAAHTVIIGARNLDELEKQRIRESRAHVFTMKDIDRDGIAAVMTRALAIVCEGTSALHVSFDLDVCDPAIAPGVGTPAKGGLNYREAHMVMEMIADTGRLTALDLVEVNPILDVQNQTAILAAELALSALGMRII